MGLAKVPSSLRRNFRRSSEGGVRRHSTSGTGGVWWSAWPAADRRGANSRAVTEWHQRRHRIPAVSSRISGRGFHSPREIRYRHSVASFTGTEPASRCRKDGRKRRECPPSQVGGNRGWDSCLVGASRRSLALTERSEMATDDGRRRRHAGALWERLRGSGSWLRTWWIQETQKRHP
jgi:hypothetical protein